MPGTTKYYISEILEDVCGKLGDITGAVFSEHRPEAIGEQLTELIVVSVNGALYELNVCQQGNLTIELMVRNKAHGIANTKRLGEMANAVASRFPMTNSRYSATSPRIMLRGQDGVGFTIWNIQAKLLVNTTDRYE